MTKGKQCYNRFGSITEAHRALGLQPPKHPLISLVNVEKQQLNAVAMRAGHVLDFYKISYRSKFSSRLRYGQSYYDFDEGGLLFAAPNQIIGGGEPANVEEVSDTVYALLIHPDFFLGHALSKTIGEYGFFSYAVNEALHVSESEKQTILSIINMIEDELDNRIDDLSQELIISQIELLLNYAKRFYRRQFITRKSHNHGVLQNLEELLNEYFSNGKSLELGIPTVQYLSDQLNVSSSYLSDMLRTLTGQNAQQHIHNKLIEKAKEKLSTTQLTVGEIAYELGFEYSQSFSRLFKSKTSHSPLKFRQMFQ